MPLDGLAVMLNGDIWYVSPTAKNEMSAGSVYGAPVCALDSLLVTRNGLQMPLVANVRVTPAPSRDVDGSEELDDQDARAHNSVSKRSKLQEPGDGNSMFLKRKTFACELVSSQRADNKSKRKVAKKKKHVAKKRRASKKADKKNKKAGKRRFSSSSSSSSSSTSPSSSESSVLSATSVFQMGSGGNSKSCQDGLIKSPG